MKKELENLNYILKEEKIQKDFEELKNNAKIKIKLIYNNGFECFDYFKSESEYFFREIKRLQNQIKNGLLKNFEIIK